MTLWCLGRTSSVLSLACALSVSVACASREPGGDAASALGPRARAAGASAGAVLGPARYVVPDSGAWVERTSDGLDRVVANGARLEVRGVDIVRAAASEPEVEAGFPLPSWALAPSGAAGAAPIRYLFWKDKELYGAPGFLDDLVKITTTDGDISRAFDWVNGVGLLTASGALLVAPGSGSGSGAAPGLRVVPFPVLGAVDAIAADARRGVVLTTFGHTFVTADGGASFRDESAELGEAARVEVRGDEIVVLLQGDRRRFVAASGAIADSSTATGPKRGARPPAIDERWPPSASQGPIEAAGVSGVPLGGGEVLVATRGHVARVDVASGKATASAEIPEPSAQCAPIRVADALLLACEGKERASLIDVTASPRVERTFDLNDAADYDRFVGVDGEAIGYVGPCDGSPPRERELDVVTSASPYNTSSQRSSVFCVRASRDTWVEHRLDPEDQAAIMAWIPRAGGEAAAIIARPGTFIPDAERVSLRGKLRVVRVAKSEPPLTIPQYSHRGSLPLARSLRVLPDGSIEGWLPTTSYPSNTLAVTIDPAGRVRVRPTPSRATSLSVSGAFGMAQTEDGKLYETSDWGRRWIPVERPPGSPVARISTCSAAGCRVGPFIRVGWASADPAALAAAGDVLAMSDEILTPAALRAIQARQYRRPPPAPPIVRLRCEQSSPSEGARIPESYGFGVTPAPVARSAGPSKLAWAGAIILPWSGSQMLTSGDAEVAWLPLLDVAAPVHRVMVPLSRMSFDLRYKPYDVRLGYVIDEGGHVDPIAVGPKDACIAAILEQAGLTRAIGGCAPEATLGVDLGSRLVLHSARYGSHIVSVVDLPSRSASAKGRGAAASPALAPPSAPAAAGPIVIAQRELYKTPVAGGSYGYVYAVGSRAGAPVVIAVDGKGGAVLAPIDPDRGTLGAEEPMAPLTSVALGSDPKCAKAPDQARVVLNFDTEIGVDRASLSGVSAAGTYGLAVLRWSRSQACLDAIELSVRDERYELDLGYYEPSGTIRKLVARFVPAEGGKSAPVPRVTSLGSSAIKPPGAPKGAGNGMLALIMYGSELRQRVSCTGIAP